MEERMAAPLSTPRKRKRKHCGLRLLAWRISQLDSEKD
jgi:hypothetical protein